MATSPDHEVNPEGNIKSVVLFPGPGDLVLSGLQVFINKGADPLS